MASSIDDKLRAWICERNEEAVLFDGYEDAVIGMVDHVGPSGRTTVVAYDGDKCIDILMKREECDEEQAWDWFSYNTLRSMSYAGDHAPVVFWRYDAANE